MYELCCAAILGPSLSTLKQPHFLDFLVPKLVYLCGVQFFDMHVFVDLSDINGGCSLVYPATPSCLLQYTGCIVYLGSDSVWPGLGMHLSLLFA